MSQEEYFIKCGECGRYYEKKGNRYCDTCKKRGNSFPINVTVHTDRWGNDSIDSYEYLDYCSIECLLKMTNDNIGDGSWDYEIKMNGLFIKKLLKEDK